MKSFGKPTNGETLDNKFYVEVDSDEQKISALQNLIQVLNPTKLYVAVRDVQSKSEAIQSDLFGMVGNSVVWKMKTWSMLCSEYTQDNPKGSVLVVFDGVCQEQPLPNVDLTVMPSTGSDREALVGMGIRELSASAFIFYHGPCLPT